MESAISKRRRLFAGSSVPSRILSQLLMRIRQEPDMEELLNMSEHQLNRAISSLWPTAGVTLQVGGCVWDVASLPKVLGHVVSTSPMFRQAVRTIWQSGAGMLAERPAHLIVYAVEATPGNAFFYYCCCYCCCCLIPFLPSEDYT